MHCIVYIIGVMRDITQNKRKGETMKNKTENKIDHLKAAAQLIDKANDEL